MKKDRRTVGGRGCPICGKPAEADSRPFCSRRCREIDLHRWLGGHYALPAEEIPSRTDEDAADNSMRIGSGQSDSDCL